MPSLLAIANSDAGTADDEAIDRVMVVLRRNFDVELTTTSTPEDLAEVLAEHPGVDGVVVLGGDGSLHAVVAALHSADRLADVVVGLIPLGTGNDFGRTLGLPDDPEFAAEVIVAGGPRRIDLLIDGDDHVVVNAAHIGIGAEAAAVARPWKKALGPIGYAVGTLLAGIRGLVTSGARLDIRLNGEPLPRKERVIQLAVGNGRFVGGGAELLPRADPFDGELDLAVSYAASPWRRIAYARSLRRGDHHRRDDVVYLRGTEVTVHGDALRCTSDGELTAPSPRHSWRVEPGALTMYVPQPFGATSSA